MLHRFFRGNERSVFQHGSEQLRRLRAAHCYFVNRAFSVRCGIRLSDPFIS
jgi:hypothetical protein